MSKLRFAPVGLLVAAIGLTAVPAMVGITSAAYAQTAMRPEVGKPLQAAQELLKNRKYREALTKLHELDSVAGKTPNEIYNIEFTRASAASQAGDYSTAVKSYEEVLNSGKLPAAQQVQVLQALGSYSYQLHDYPKTISYISRYLKEGGNDPQMRALLTQTYFQSGDYSQVTKDVQAQVQADEKAGRAPS
jgi:tetratricopeptide (TPR) repeat protein